MREIKKTKIIATLGPSTDTEDKIYDLYMNGANIVRMNYSHTNYEYFGKIIDTVHRLNAEKKTNLWVLTDTKWPEIRTKAIEEKIDLEKWDIFILTTLANEKDITNEENRKVIVCDYEYIVSDLNIWHIIDIDTGLLKAKIIEKKSGELICEALNKHSVWSKRHLNLPGIKLHLPGITESDKADIKFAVEKWTDFIALSFVRNAENIRELRSYLLEIDAPKWIQIISKIENQEALDNIDEIIDETDGIMIARWDLWAEIPFETLPMVQKIISKKCKDNWVFFIVATQILETMTTNPIPTRAEITDIFNAAMQKADCVMLSWETAAWQYPIETIRTMKSVLKYSETQVKYKHEYFTKDIWEHEDRKQLIKNAVYVAENIEAKALMVFTESGFMAKTISAFRPSVPVYTFTFADSILKKLTILFWLKTFWIEKNDSDTNIKNALEKIQEQNLVQAWDKIVTVYGMNKWDEIIPSIQVITIK